MIVTSSPLPQLSFKNERKNISSGEDVILAHDMTVDEQLAVDEWDEQVAEWECWYA